MTKAEIAMRLYKVAMDSVRGFVPAFLMFFGLIIAFTIGGLGTSSWWWLLFPAVLSGWALGWAEDRAEARAKVDFAERFLRLIECDHIIEVTINHANVPAKEE